MDSLSLLAKITLNNNSVSAHHFALFCLYLLCRPNASVSVDCREEGSASRGAVFFSPVGKTGSGVYALGGHASLLCCLFLLPSLSNKFGLLACPCRCAHLAHSVWSWNMWHLAVQSSYFLALLRTRLTSCNHSVSVANASGPASPHRDKDTGWLARGFSLFVPLWNKRAKVLRRSTEWTLLSSSRAVQCYIKTCLC